MFCLVWFYAAKRKLEIREESEVSAFTENDGTDVEKDTLGEGIKTVLVKKFCPGKPLIGALQLQTLSGFSAS